MMSSGSNLAKQLKQSSVLYASLAIALLPAAPALALPTGGSVASGNVTINTPNANQMNVNQGSNKAVINWQGFDINSNEAVQFNQPSANSVALNRVGGRNASQIMGKLSANGKLMLVNPNGVFFGPSSQVDVAGLVATTSDISDADFLAGKMNFNKPGRADASIVNQGKITAAQGGLVALVAPSVRNDGVIEAKLGTVALAGGDKASVDLYGDGLYSFAISDQGGSVANSGKISAEGGRVLLTADSAKNIVDYAVNNTGVIEASSAHYDGGAIVLDGGNGNVNVGGTLDASGIKGGNITVTGKDIAVSSGAQIAARGETQGGNVKIGGDFHGEGSVKTAQKVSVKQGAVIDVSAKTGNAGTAVVWSDDATDFAGTLFGSGWDGAKAEISGKNTLVFSGLADLHGNGGANGSLLLDPTNVTIDAIMANALKATLNSNTDVTVDTSAPGADAGDITLAALLDWTGQGSLTLNADNNIILNNNITSTTSAGTGDRGAVTLNAGNDIIANNAAVSTNRGNITMNSVDVSLNNSTAKSTTGGVAINNSGIFASTLADSLAGLRGVSLRQNIGGSIQNAINAIGTTGAAGSLLQLGTGTFTQAFNVNQSNIIIRGNGSANTIIQAPAAATNPVINVNGPDLVTLQDFAVQGGQVGISATGGNKFTVSGVSVSGASQAGVKLNGTKEAMLIGNQYTGNGIGVDTQNSILSKVLGSNFSGNGTGVRANSDTSLRVDGNSFTNGIGVRLTKVNGSPVENNSFTDVSTGIIAFDGVSLVANNNQFVNATRAIDADFMDGVTVSNNVMNGVGTDAVDVSFSKRISIVGNQIRNYVNGIISTSNNAASIRNNVIENISGDGIRVSGGTAALVQGNTLNNAATGVHVLNKSFNTSVLDNTITGGSLGMLIDDITLFWLRNNDITNATTAGIRLNAARNGTIGGTLAAQGNRISGSPIGIDSINSNLLTPIQNNMLTNNSIGMQFNGDQGLRAESNTITGGTTGMSLTNVNGARIITNNLSGMDNAITAFGGDSLFMQGNIIDNVDTGVTATNVNGLTLQGNSLSNGGTVAMNVTGGDNLVIDTNTIDGFADGALVDATTNASLTGNIISNIPGDGIRLTSSSDALIDGNVITFSGTGISLDNPNPGTPNTSVIVRNNTVSDSGIGLFAEGTNSLNLRNNTFIMNTAGAAVSDMQNLIVENNIFQNNSLFGLGIEGSDNLVMASNIYHGNNVGLQLVNSNNASIANGTWQFNGNAIVLDNSDNAFLQELTLSLPAGGNGIVIQNGSGGTLARGLTLTGGNIGVLLDGAGSSMQFTSNTSSFSGQNFYFVVQNNAMLGDTLDASQQIFGGVRASDFTVAQRDAAEAITIDVEDLGGRGNVFYKAFTQNITGGGGGNLLGFDSNDALISGIQNPYQPGLFSYSGRTITNNLAQTPFSFEVPEINLSLLSPAAGGGSATSLAALSPAAGAGTQIDNISPIAPGSDPAALAALQPAAGGDVNAQQLAALEPAAGGSPNCGNNFLGAGFNPAFNEENCSLQGVQ